MIKYTQILFKNLVDAFIGLSSANTLNIVHERVDDQQRGKSPNKTSLRLMQLEYALISIANVIETLTFLKWTKVTNLAAGLTFGLPALVSVWPKDSNYENFKKSCQNLKDRLRRPLNWLFGIFNFFVQKTPLIRIFFKPSIKLVDFIDQHLTKIFLALNIGSYIALFLVGSYALAGSALTIYTLGILDRKNLLGNSLRNFMKKYLIPISLIGSVFYGNLFEKITAITMITMSYGQYFQSFVISLFSTLRIKKDFVAALKEQQRKINALDFTCEAKNFIASLDSLQNSACGITKAHVLDNIALLPPLHPEQELDELLTLFDSVDDWGAHEKAIEMYKQNDWRAKREQEVDENSLFPPSLTQEELKVRHVAFMRGNIERFVNRLKTGDLRSVKAGTEEILIRYTKAIIFILKQYPRNSIELVDRLIHLGFETGEYCPKRLLEALETSYRFQMHIEKDPDLKKCVRFIHQFNREQYFQNIYLQEELHDLYWEELFFFPQHSKSTKCWRNDPMDIHAHEKAVAFWAPRLGLPALYFEYDIEQDNPIAGFWYNALSARSPVERRFWQETSLDLSKIKELLERNPNITNEELKIEELKQQIRNGVNTPLLPLATVATWYHNFIDTHVMGTEAEKDALKEQNFYDIEYHAMVAENEFEKIDALSPGKTRGTVPIYKLKEEIIHLMMLDFGIIHLKASENSKENTFRYQPKEVVSDLVKETLASPAKTLQFSNTAAQESDVPSIPVSAPESTPTLSEAPRLSA